MREKLIAAAAAVDAIVAEVPELTEGMGLHGSTFKRDMEEALDGGGDSLMPSVFDVLDAMRNWSVMAARRAGLTSDDTPVTS